MKKKIILFLFICVNVTSIAQINKNGIPFIKNYTTSDYNAAEQNWTICEDERGVIYIGNNNDGVLMFDGKNWNKIPISNGSIIRSLVYSKDGTVYVGGVEEFGYLAPDILGKMQYYTLINQLDSINFKDVWKIFNIDLDVYFCTQFKIYKFVNKKLISTYKNSGYSYQSFLVDDKIYWDSYDKGLYEITDDSIKYSVGGEFYQENDVFAMLPWGEDEIFISTMEKGNYIYNKITGLSKNLSSLGNNFKKLNEEVLLKSQIYNGVQLSNGNYALATLNNGCLIFNNKGDLLFKLDKENGLQDLTVINLFEASDGNLWLGLNKGISYIELKTPFTKFGQEYGIDGIISHIKRYNGVLYVATNIGLYYLDYDDNELPYFKNIPMEKNTVWSMQIFNVPNSDKKKLLLATDLGILECKIEKTPKKLVEKPYISEVVYQSKITSAKLYVGYSGGLALIEYLNGNWIDKGRVGEIATHVKSITEDEKGNLWLGTALTGVIKLKPDMSQINYGIESGLPDLLDNKVYNIDGEIVCATINGVFTYNKQNDNFEKYKGFGEKYHLSDHKVKSINHINDNEYWIIAKDPITNYDYIEKISVSMDGLVSIENIPFKRLIKNSFQEIAADDNNGVWIPAADAIYNYLDKDTEAFTKNYYSLISKVRLGIDSVVFWGNYYKDTSNFIIDFNQPNELTKTLPYKENSLQLFYSSPYFPDDELKYTYKLEGFEDKWSAWEEKTEKEYTNLNEGRYFFKVKAKNIYGIESEIVSYEFIIKPPWYRTILAYFFYFVLGILVIIVIVKIYTRRLEQEKIRLEQIVKERTEEVVKQKDELEIQRDEIADKNRSITDSIKYAERIQKAILPSDEYAKEILPEHFILFRPRDIVSGDFYWMTKKDDLLVVIAADCTGHGVPGAFMSMLGVSFLNEIVNRHKVTSAGDILTNLRRDIKKTLGQEGKEGEAKDGMDIALCVVDLKNMKMQYSGAYNPLYMFRNNEFIETKADRMPIGIYVKEKDSFTNNEIDLQKGDVFYIFSDGFQDQFGGEDGRKFKTKNYKQLLLDIHQKPMAEQHEILDTTIDKWRGKWEQVDDIIIMGIRV